ncbi:hypothetical protein GCM10023093_16970 [Nemorincola caseinilytica]|uniref:Peptidase C51 domain-containing protein n=1 Tax=Nemorincola caseinilytica TaxID=2054315 RepID=A0ABP8NCW0_9BACT
MVTPDQQGRPSISQLALQIALAQVGQRETPGRENSGPMIDKYLAAVGLPPGYAWCQAFVNWCYEEAALQLSTPEPVPNTGGVLECWRRTPDNMRISAKAIQARPEILLPGDQFIMKVGTKGAGHTGLIVNVRGNKLLTVEGNTNDEGSREGYEVAMRTRNVLMPELLGAIRYTTPGFS